jgi:DNA polymerase III delta prime subunit
MYAETYRPTNLSDVIGHDDAKKTLRTYLTTSGFPKAIMLTGSPGIGKTTLAIAAAKTMEFDPLEINASRSIRSYEDVERIKDACRSAVNIFSFMKGDRNRKTCVILDEVDGSDPHAQARIVEWIKDTTRKVPIICTGNELPTIFKRNTEHIEIVRCFPPKAADIQTLFLHIDIADSIKECQHDIRKLIHMVQYGASDPIPKYLAPPTGLTLEKTFLLRQKMFELPDSLHEYRSDIQDTEPIVKTSSRRKRGDKHDHTVGFGNLQTKLLPDKLHSLMTR